MNENPKIGKTLERRLYKKGIRAPSGCLEYTGYICPSTGYGKISNNPHNPIGTHRAAWIIKNGDIPKGLVVRHKCDNRKCFEIEHLELGTYTDNNMDAVNRGRFDNYKSRISVCPKGHSYNSTDHEGYRLCKVCRLMSARKRQARKRAERGVVELSNYCHDCWYIISNCHCSQIASITSAEVRYHYKKERVFA